MFTVSSEQAVIVTNREKTLVTFKNLLCELHRIDAQDKKERILVWILRWWNRGSDDVNNKFRYENVQSLILRFKAFTGYFGDPQAKATWEWLKSRAVVVAIQEAFNRRLDLSQNILFGAVPNKWAPLLEFRILYGDDLAHVDRASYNVFLRPSANSLSKKDSSDIGEEYHLRYFGHAKIAADGEDPEVKGIELPSPGRDYDQAFGLVHAAAAYLLNLGSTEEQLNKGKEAEEKLRVLGCSLMQVEEFVKL
jgi:hypothetical protein